MPQAPRAEGPCDQDGVVSSTPVAGSSNLGSRGRAGSCGGNPFVNSRLWSAWKQVRRRLLLQSTAEIGMPGGQHGGFLVGRGGPWLRKSTWSPADWPGDVAGCGLHDN